MKLLSRWWRRSDAGGIAVLEAPAEDDVSEDGGGQLVRHLVDANTRTFWSRGDPVAATLVETDGHGEVSGVRVRQLIAGPPPAAGGRPRGNPAFAEAVFVELMRARRWQRAFELLAPDCQRSWGEWTAFAAAQSHSAMRFLKGVDVRAARPLTGWRDPASGVVHDHAVELEADYTLDNGHRQQVVHRQVHLVAADGKWRSLCYPEAAPEA